MFSIYREGVRSFSGTLERLDDVRPVERVSPRRSVTLQTDRERGRPSSPLGVEGVSYGLTPAAIAAYRDAANLTIREPILHAYQIMRFPVVTVSVDADIQDAWLRLRKHRIRQMPVQNARVELVGLLSERELLEQLVVERDQIRYGQAKTVSEVMSREVITAEPVTDLRRMARVMAERGMSAMPIVTAEDELVGIVSRGDLLRAMVQTPPLRLWT